VLAGILACFAPDGRDKRDVQGGQQACDEDPEAGSSDASQSVGEAGAGDLSLASSVPRPLAVFFPFAVFSVMFLFFFADLDLGTSVDLEIAAGGQTTTFGNLFTFSLTGTIVKTWEAKAYAISILTLLFSGVWPLVKLILLLVAWLAPPRRIGMATRGRLLSFLDVWGKYSFLDSWFLVLCMSAFSMEWQGGGTSLDVHTRPTAAYYAFLLATILSLLLGNVASFFHRHAEVGDSTQGDAAASTATAGPRALGRVGRSLLVHAFVAALLVLSVAVTLAGAVATSFEFGMSGLGANVIFQESHHTEPYSLVGVGVGVSASSPGNVGLVALEVVFLLLSLVVPVLSLIALAVLWIAPLKADQQDMLLYVSHVLDTWSTLDVFVLAVLVGHAEFSELAGRLLSTGSLRAVCVPLQQHGLSCMELDLGLLPCFGLFAAAGALALVVPKAVHQLCRANARARGSNPKASDAVPEEAARRSTFSAGSRSDVNDVQPSAGG